MGSVSKLPTGRWRARYRDEYGKQTAKHFDTKRQGERWLAEISASMLTGRYVDPAAGKITFEAYFERWIEIQTYETTTVRAMRLAVKDADFKTLPLNRIRGSHVQAWVKKLSDRLAAGTVKTRFHNVRTVLRAAQHDRLIADDPTLKIKLPTQSAESTLRIPSPREMAAILDAADPEFRVFVSLCAFAGLRLGEAAALKPQDLNFFQNKLHVLRQVQRATGGGVEIRLPKYGSTRTVAIPAELAQAVGSVIENRPPADLSTWLFAPEADDPPHQNTIGNRWRTACRRAGVKGVRLHDLRHYYVSGLIAQGCDVITVQKALGHKKATTTLKTYGHLWPTAEDLMRTAASALITETLSASAVATGGAAG